MPKNILHRYRFAFRHAGVEHYAHRFYPEKQDQETLDRDCADWVEKYRVAAIQELEEQLFKAKSLVKRKKLEARINAWRNG